MTSPEEVISNMVNTCSKYLRPNSNSPQNVHNGIGFWGVNLNRAEFITEIKNHEQVYPSVVWGQTVRVNTQISFQRRIEIYLGIH